MYIKDIKTVKYSSNADERNEAVVELYVDNSSELPEKESDIAELAGISLSQGSMGYVINTGSLYVMNSDGEWVDTNGVKK